ncbi:MAG: NAD(P)H-binding protein, partial [Pseudomonadota bacterium]
MVGDRGDHIRSRRIFVLGATGTIGRATVRALVARGHHVVCLVRRSPDDGNESAPSADGPDLPAAEFRIGDVTDPASLARDGIRGERFDVLLSCLASRTGAPDDAWRIDHDTHVGALEQAKAAGISHMILLSAICVQKPVLEFQQAKLAFERKLAASGIDYTIIRPTAFFKSLSGQVERVRRGKPFLLFGDGTATACKPISDADLAAFLADCIDNPDRSNRILPIGGPGPAITPRMQGERLFALLGRPPRFRHVPVALLDGIVLTLATLGRLAPSLK